MDLEKEGVIHRNICRENILVQDGKPVLLDFSWAISEQEPYFSPLGLGGYERPPDGSFSDVYSMGKILEYVNRQHYRAFDWVISLMTMRDASIRITDLDALKLLFHAALKITVQDDTDPERVQKALGQLLEQIAKRDQKIAWTNAEKDAALRALEEKDLFLTEKDAILRFTEGQLNQILTSRAWKFTAWIQQMRLLLVPLESRRARVLERILNSITRPFGKNKKS